MYLKRQVTHRAVHLQQVWISETVEIANEFFKWQTFFNSILKSGDNFTTLKHYYAIRKSSKITACEFKSTKHKHQ